jgi:SprT protein
MPTDHQNPVEMLQQRALEVTDDLLKQAARHLGIEIPGPQVRFDLRGKAAGQARMLDGRNCEIRYNRALLARYPEDFLARTVPHEAAHVVVFRLYGRRVKPHGPEWKGVMSLFGAEPTRCHSYDVGGLQGRRLARYRYRCACRSHELTSIRHNRIRGGQIYLCRHCGTALTRAFDEPTP